MNFVSKRTFIVCADTPPPSPPVMGVERVVEVLWVIPVTLNDPENRLRYGEFEWDTSVVVEIRDGSNRSGGCGTPVGILVCEVDGENAEELAALSGEKVMAEFMAKYACDELSDEFLKYSQLVKQRNNDMKAHEAKYKKKNFEHLEKFRRCELKKVKMEHARGIRIRMSDEDMYDFLLLPLSADLKRILEGRVRNHPPLPKPEFPGAPLPDEPEDYVDPDTVVTDNDATNVFSDISFGTPHLTVIDYEW